MQLLTRLLSSSRCIGCSGPALPSEFCPACAHWLAQGVAPFPYDGPLGRAFTQAKLRGAPYWPALLRHVGKVQTSAQIVTVVPPAFGRTLLRGYHPPDVLGFALAMQLGLPFHPRLMMRADFGRQLGRTRALRRRQPRFVPNPLPRWLRVQVPVRGLHVLVVDDVVTTGATRRAAAACLGRLGVSAVSHYALLAVD